MLKSILCNYSHVYILVKGTITVPSMAGECAATINANKKVMLNVCHKQAASEINNKWNQPLVDDNGNIIEIM